MKRVVSFVKVMFHTFGACSKSQSLWCFKRALVRHPGNSCWNYVPSLWRACSIRVLGPWNCKLGVVIPHHLNRWKLLRSRLHGRGVTHPPELPRTGANSSYISFQNFANRSHEKPGDRLLEKQKVGSARRVTRLAESPFFDGRITLLAWPAFFI